MRLGREPVHQQIEDLCLELALLNERTVHGAMEEGPAGVRAMEALLPEDALWRLVQASFRERRKMLHNVLVRQLPLEPARVDAALAAAGIAPDRRPQTVAVGEWLALLEALGEIGQDTRGRRRE